MAKKATALATSLWLPGFDPEEPPAPADTFLSVIVPVATPEPPPVQVEAPVAAIEHAAPKRTPSWRRKAVTTTPTVRTPQPRLRSEDIGVIGGRAAKFDANLRAIELLAQLEAGQHQASAEERLTMARYTGWGGLPAAFNLEGKDASWTARARRLQDCLQADDYESARASVNNSHYTPLSVIDAIWAAVIRLGFTGGRVLEPAAGVGHFIGAMPDALARNTDVTAVEIDRISGRLLQAMYGPSGVSVHIEAFEKTPFPDQWFDLVIGNVPFGNYKVAETSNRPYAGFSIHNYFLARSLDLLRPGGLLALITSSHTLETYSASARQYLASKAHLLGAIRLPGGAFAEMAGTDVQTDILFLQTRQASEAIEAEWTERVNAPGNLVDPRSSRPYMPVNVWYAKHPEWLIGRLSLQSNGYEEVPTATHEGPLEPELRQRIALLPEGIYRPAPAPAAPLHAVVSAEPGARPGTFCLHGGRVHRVDGQALVDVDAQFNGTQKARIAGMCAIRDHARALLDAQLAEDGDGKLGSLRAMLNGTYDRYVAKYGFLSNRANALAFRRDPDYPLLLSLEHYDEDEGTATKAAIFSKRTLARVSEPSSVNEPTEALAASMQWRGRVDAGYMATLLSAPEDAVIDALAEAGHVFHDPAEGEWKTADEYLSGNVKLKLRQARMGGTACQRNVEALLQVQPQDLPPASIEVRLGAVWIPAADVEAFLHEVLELKNCSVRYSAEAGAWSVEYQEWSVRHSVKATQEFGTARMHAVQLVLCALNVQTPTVKDPLPDSDRYIVNSAETLAAREKLGLLKDRFGEWAFEDMARRERLCALYNELFNATRQRKFDGSHLVLPGFSQCFKLHPHQKDAVWRILQSGNTGLFHTVGAGKTAVAVIASMELRRLGFASKPCHVVPNHMLAQYTAEFVQLYPQASVLMASKEDLEGDRRRELVSRIATGAWDAIVITHASFERIKTSPEFMKGFIQEVIHDIELAVRAAKSDNGSNRIVKQLEKTKKSWAARLEKLSSQEKKDDLLSWEQLGIDWLFNDESHLFKNLFRFSKMRVAGLPMASSERAFDLYVKTRHIMKLHGNRQRGVVLATATPVANTMAEIHTMQRYLQPRRLEELGLQQFDAWAATFGEAVTALEIAPDGSGYRMHTRFARFINVPELMSIFGEVADIQTAEMLKLPVPKLKGGKPRIVTCPPSAQLKAFVQTLVERAARVRSGQVKPEDDNMLAVTNDGRKAALDFRLIAPASRFDPEGKVAACAREVHAVWQRTAATLGTQLVFCDLSSPKGGKSFSVYDDLRQRLIDTGIPEAQIAFIHDASTDAQKARLFKSVRKGSVRVLLGSTQKMGIGTNVQRKLAAQHDLDAPWRPCDVEQREGRILRQGNMNDEVEIFRYVTEASFDAYSWQTLETKARFISQVMRGDASLRSVEDVALATLSYAEVKALASGNPLVIEKAGLDAEITKLATLHSVWRNQRYANEREISALPLLIQTLEKKLAAHEADLAQVQPQAPASISVQLGARVISGAEAVGDALRGKVQATRQQVIDRLGRPIDDIVGRFGGLELGISCQNREEVPAFYLAGAAIYHATAYQTGPALVTGLLDALESISEQSAHGRTQLETRRKRLDDLQIELSRPFEHQLRLDTLLERHEELLRQLDITKDEDGSHQAEAESALANV